MNSAFYEFINLKSSNRIETYKELLSDYRTDKEFTTFTDLDGEEIKTAIKAVIDAD